MLLEITFNFFQLMNTCHTTITVLLSVARYFLYTMEQCSVLLPFRTMPHSFDVPWRQLIALWSAFVRKIHLQDVRLEIFQKTDLSTENGARRGYLDQGNFKDIPCIRYFYVSITYEFKISINIYVNWLVSQSRIFKQLWR